jgi:hypothetical protein
MSRDKKLVAVALTGLGAGTLFITGLCMIITGSVTIIQIGLGVLGLGLSLTGIMLTLIEGESKS